MNRRGRAVIGTALGLYLLGMGMLAGVIVERIRFDERRAEVLARYQRALRARNMQLMNLEGWRLSARLGP